MIRLNSRYFIEIAAKTKFLEFKKPRFLSAASKLDDEELEEVLSQPTFLNDGFEEAAPDPTKFNKSRLNSNHRNLLNETLPFSQPHSWIHVTEKYQRKMYGRYGAESGIDPRISFKTKAEIADAKAYEKIAHPHSLMEMREKVRIDQEEKRAQIKKREDDILKKLDKLEDWKNELKAKVAKKEADAQAAKERKERLIEEVRRHFGFKIDPRDERFKEMLEQKEREDKKKQKEAKRKAKGEKMFAKLIEKNENSK